jgi:hypothetical protein
MFVYQKGFQVTTSTDALSDPAKSAEFPEP